MADDKADSDIDLYGDDEPLETDIPSDGDAQLGVDEEDFFADEGSNGISIKKERSPEPDDDAAEPPAKRVKLEDTTKDSTASISEEDGAPASTSSELPDGLVMGVSVQGRLRKVPKADLGHPSGTPLDLQLVPDSGKPGSVFLGNLSWWTSDVEVANALYNSGIKDIIAVRVFENRTNGQSKGFACIETTSEATARNIMAKVKEFAIHGQIPIAQLTSRTTMNSFEALSRRGTERPSEVSLTNRVGPVTAQGLRSRVGSTSGSSSGGPSFTPPARPTATISAPTPATRATPLLQRRLPPNPTPPRPAMPRPPAWMPHPHVPGLPPHIDSLLMAARPQLPPSFPHPPGLPGVAPPMLRMHGMGLPPPLPPRPPMPSAAAAAAMAAAAARAPPPHAMNLPPVSMPGAHPHSAAAAAVAAAAAAASFRHPPAPHVNPAFLAASNHALEPPSRPTLVSTAPSLPTASQTHAAMAAVAANAMTRLKSSTLGQATEEELQESMKRNHAISTSAILRAMQDANAGDFNGAVDTLKTAISLIKQSVTATAESSVALIQSLQECLSGIESQAYTTKSTSGSRAGGSGRDREAGASSLSSRDRGRRSPDLMEDDYHRSSRSSSHRSSHPSSRHHDHHDPYRSDRHDARSRSSRR